MYLIVLFIEYTLVKAFMYCENESKEREKFLFNYYRFSSVPQSCFPREVATENKILTSTSELSNAFKAFYKHLGQCNLILKSFLYGYLITHPAVLQKQTKFFVITLELRASLMFSEQLFKVPSMCFI